MKTKYLMAHMPPYCLDTEVERNQRLGAIFVSGRGSLTSCSQKKIAALPEIAKQGVIPAAGPGAIWKGA